jgi:hypothetical protein
LELRPSEELLELLGALPFIDDDHELVTGAQS